MTVQEKISTLHKLTDKLGVKRRISETAQVYRGELCANLSDLFTSLIKDAARCNRYSSDVIYSIEEINNICKNYDEEEEYPPVLIACRKDGVDHASFILSRCEENCYNVYKEYFAFYSVEFIPDGFGFTKIVWTEYAV